MNCAQIGPPGSGKTQSLLTILGFVEEKRKPFVIIDADGKLKDNPDFKKPIADGKFIIFDPGNRLSSENFQERIKRIGQTQPPKDPPKGWMGLGDILDDIDTNHSQFCGAAIDTISTVEDHIKRFISFTNKRGKFEFADWDALLLSWKELFSFFYSLDMPLKIINMHTQYEKEELTGKITLLPLITGSFRNQAGRDMSEFYLNFTKANPGKPPSYLWRVAPDDKFVARSVVLKGQIEVSQDWTPIWKTLL